jgi:hypothetical protein
VRRMPAMIRIGAFTNHDWGQGSGGRGVGRGGTSLAHLAGRTAMMMTTTMSVMAFKSTTDTGGIASLAARTGVMRVMTMRLMATGLARLGASNADTLETVSAPQAGAAAARCAIRRRPRAANGNNAAPMRGVSPSRVARGGPEAGVRLILCSRRGGDGAGGPRACVAARGRMLP